MSISIITTVYNNEKFIKSCLDSIINQKFKKNKLEHVIIDGGSTDSTVKIIKKKNNFIKLFIKKNTSIYEAINFGIKKSENKIIGLLHSDDLFANNQVLNKVEKFLNNKNINAIYSNIKFTDRENIKKITRIFISRQLTFEDLKKCEHPPHTSLFIKREIFKKYGYYNTSLKIASDFEFMLRVFGIEKVKIKYINTFFVIMREGGTSTKSLKNIFRSNLEVFRSLKLNKLQNNFIYIFIKVLRKFKQLRLLN